MQRCRRPPEGLGFVRAAASELRSRSAAVQGVGSIENDIESLRRNIRMLELECRTLERPVMQRWRPKLRDVAARFKKLQRELVWAKNEDRSGSESVVNGVHIVFVPASSLLIFVQGRVDNEDALIQHGKAVQAQTQQSADHALRIVEDTKTVCSKSISLSPFARVLF
jgi:hypothetical protein